MSTDYTADIAKLEALIPEAEKKERRLWADLKAVEQDTDKRIASLKVMEEKARKEWSAASLNLECLRRVVESFKIINQTGAPEPAAEGRRE